MSARDDRSGFRTVVAVGVLVSTLAAWCAGPGTPDAEATPIYAIRSAHACSTCHTEPMGWHNPDAVKDRTCSLDCSTCHVSPTGGGLRTPSGQFYGREMLPTWGRRPSADANPERHLPEGAPSEGRYRLFEGFSGWWPGEVWHGDIEDRYGSLDPDPTWLFGADGRVMAYLPTDGRDAAIFPMQASLYGHWRPTHRWSGMIDAGLYSSRSALDVLPEVSRIQRDALDYLAVREAFVKVDRLPYKAWARAGRFKPAYGWRLPDHTTFVRRELGFDQDRSVYGLEAGINPNYPFANAGVFYQGLDGWPGDISPPGWGATVNGGIRELGWQLQGSAHWLSTFDGDLGPGVDTITLGPQYGVNLFPVVVLGQLDLRQRLGPDGPTTLAAYHEANWRVIRGLSGRLKYDWIDFDTRLADDHLHRVTLGVEWHPFTFNTIEAQVRHSLAGGGVAFVGSAAAGTEVLVMWHGWR